MDPLDSDDEEAPELEPERRVTPVTILCGFLGAGKSTIIRTLIAESGRKLAVVTNEVADTSGLESLITAGGGLLKEGEIIELRNGCVCCAVKDELAQSLELLATRVKPDAILVELSGAANPGPAASSFWLDDALESNIRLDAVVCAVDCVHVQKAARVHEFKAQVSCADRVVLTKPDLGDARQARALLPDVEIREAVRGAGIVEFVLDAHSFGVNARRDLERVGAFATHAGPVIATLKLLERSPVDAAKFQDFLADLLWREEPSVVRIKGFLRVDGEFHIVQAVYDLFEVTPIDDPPDMTPFLVFIGFDLDKAAITDAFYKCC